MNGKKVSLVEHGFPFARLSIVAERESWRKEVNRPTSYIHKWWARRLGSVFRGLIVGAKEENADAFWNSFYTNTCYKDTTIFDPFMGSGTTITEAIKLGMKAAGSDINPVAVSLVRTALQSYDRDAVINTYNQIEAHCADRIKHYFKATYGGEEVDVLYYFWVKEIVCDDCGSTIPLFKSSIFSKNAYPSKKPTAQSVCPHCFGINQIRYSDTSAVCACCGNTYNPQQGNVSGIEYHCPVCGRHERIIEYARRTDNVFHSHLYAKMVVDKKGEKHYLPADEKDISVFDEAKAELNNYRSFIPDDLIHTGINTSQILHYNYKRWYDLFNERQLLSFAILVEEIRKISDPHLRQLFGILMSGTLEFNNMFCTFKGEGTGAVRPLFYNHILKSELMPLEANVWGCEASSGAFSTLFKTRILRLLDYKEKPFELRQDCCGSVSKEYLRGCCIEANPTDNYSLWDNEHPLILNEDSAHIMLPDRSIDLIVTDPPFFDNVNYSELADFFFVWHKKLNICASNTASDTTRTPFEVQDNDPGLFSNKLADVFRECCRLLVDDGMMIFTYHHSKTEGWTAVYNAIHAAELCIVEVFPVKAEMSVSVSIQAAKEPINYDLVFVCKKASAVQCTSANGCSDNDECTALACSLPSSSTAFSSGDRQVLHYGYALKCLSNKKYSTITDEDIIKILATIEN